MAISCFVLFIQNKTQFPEAAAPHPRSDQCFIPKHQGLKKYFCVMSQCAANLLLCTTVFVILAFLVVAYDFSS